MKTGRTPLVRAARKSAPEATEHAPAGSAVRLALRRRQRLPLEEHEENHTFALESGCLTVDVSTGERRHVLLILYPGERIDRGMVPPLPNIGLTAVTPSSVTRTLTAPRAASGAIEVTAAPLGVAGANTARLAARLGLHAITIGCLSSEERLATLLAEIALFTGLAGPLGCSFDLLLSREDMADYLAINPDTLSRLMSRLRSQKLLAMSSRSRATVGDLDALLAMSPLSRALRQMRPDPAPVDQAARNGVPA